MTTPASPGSASPVLPADDELEYVGFWPRVGASLIDTVLLCLIVLPLMLWIYGDRYFSLAQPSLVEGMADFIISWVAPAIAVMAFWVYKQATPGKMAVSARVVDARTGAPLTVVQSVVRYAGYFVSTIPFGLGLIWVGLDRRKQGWHDKIAGTYVVKA